MSFRTRLALVSAVAVGLAVVGASALVFVLVRNELHSQSDSTLRTRAADLARQVDVVPAPLGGIEVRLPPPPFGIYLQAVYANGAVQRGSRYLLPSRGRVLDVARGNSGGFMSNAKVGDRDVRMLTVGGPGFALEIAHDVTDVNRTLNKVELILILIAAGGVAVALGLGLAVATAALKPVRRLTETAEHVTATGDLSERIEVTGHDELSRLAGSFNTMLGALEESSRAQRQLVADASHELRTPLTSLRTNIEVLARGDKLPPGERDRLLQDVIEQMGEMTALIGELIELAREERTPEEPEDVRLDLIAADAVERAQRNRPNLVFKTEFHESLIHGAPSTIERAVANLIDNAGKWSAPGGEVEVEVRDGELTVRDHGPGIADEDLPYIFDRFYRASSARGLPGSGLGLAIVKQVADSHGGAVVAERAQGGGTIMRLRLSGNGRAS
jgi:two-component system sensor histidine kinase MprB